MKESTTMTDPRISLLRFTAMLSIIACHITQYFGLLVCEYLNIGVQVFLLIAGYLQGLHQRTYNMTYVRKLSSRLLIPYHLCLVFILIAYAVTDQFPTLLRIVSSFLCLQWFVPGIPKLGHLWYITCILMCYSITPILWKLSGHKRMRNAMIALCTVVSLALVAAGIWLDKLYYVLHYLLMFAAYIYGFAFARSLCGNWKLLSVLAFVLTVVRVAGCDIYALPSLDFIIPIQRLLTAQALVVSCMQLVPLSPLKHALPAKILAFGDVYSYCIYLTHNVFILGAFSLTTHTPSLILNIALTLGIVLVVSIVIKHLSDWIQKALQKMRIL